MRILFLLLIPIASAMGSSNLLENNPFLPTSSASVARDNSAPLELRSVLKDGDGYQFSLYDPATKSSVWSQINETGHAFVVKSYVPDKETVTVEVKGRSYSVSLKADKIALAQGGTGGWNQVGHVQTITNGPGSASGFQTGPGVMVNEAKPRPDAVTSLTPEQLRNLESDINRRRELRRQAATQAGVGQPGAGPQ
jgi:hypothetical protein